MDGRVAKQRESSTPKAASGRDLTLSGVSKAMSCKSGVPYNFGLASSLDPIVHGAARPGARSQRCFNTEDKVTDTEVGEWATFMREAGVQRVVGLLTDSELQTYTSPPMEVLRHQGLQSVNVNLEGVTPHEAMQRVEEELRAAEAANQKAALFCWGGGGRTGKVLAAWLVARHGLTPAAAAAAVEAQAQACGTSRRVDVKAVEELTGLKAPTE